MDFDSQAVQALEVVDFGIAGAAAIAFANDRPDQEAQVHHRLSITSPPLDSALIRLDSPPTKPGSPNALPEALGANWSRLAKATLDQDSFQKLVRIANRPDGWRGAGSRSLRPGALRHFLEFWMRVQNGAAFPEFSLLPNGHLQALWSSSDRRRMDLEYTESNRIYFGVLNGRRLHEGVETIDVMATLLLAHPSRPLKWSVHTK